MGGGGPRVVLVVGGAAVMATESAGRRGPLPSRSEERGKGAERGARGRCRSANETAPRRPPRNARAANRISDEGVETPTSNSDIELFILISPTVYPDEQLVGLCTLIDSSISGRGGGPKPPPASRTRAHSRASVAAGPARGGFVARTRLASRRGRATGASRMHDERRDHPDTPAPTQGGVSASCLS